MIRLDLTKQCHCPLCRPYRSDKSLSYMERMHARGLDQMGRPLPVAGMDVSDAIDEIARMMHG